MLVPAEEDRQAAPPGLRVAVYTGDGEAPSGLGDVTARFTTGGTR